MSRDCPNPRLGQDGKELPPSYKPEEVNLEEEEAMKIDQGINFDRFDKIEVEVKGGKLDPINNFKDLVTSDLLLQNIERAGYKRMTPIQRYTIPALANGHDIVGCAQTGSGKTAAFLLPVLQTILNERDLSDQYGAECQEPYCIVIAPTRELARQTYVEALKLSRDSIVKCQCIYGGTQTGSLRAQISKGTHILSATPGRLKDFINRGWIGLSKVKYIILDEGDRLIDDGFVVDMRAMFTHQDMPPKSERQTLFFSATFKQDAQNIAREFMKPNFLFITVGLVGAANEDVKQEFVKVERSQKKKELLQILQKNPDDKVIVFTQTKATADIISGYLTSMGVQCTSIHGDRHQSQREEALAHFKRGIRRCLVASPVGERGLDLPKVSIVINYDMPGELDEYVHRIGRTGRIGNTGRAISFFDPDRDHKVIGELTKALRQAQQEVPDFFDNPATHSSDFDVGNGFGDKENTHTTNAVSAVDAGADEEW
jgi:probable ATP-dependent RNA helicase DDX4